MLFGSSGIRQVFSQPLLALAPLLGAAVAKDAARVCLGTDSRTTKDILAGAVAAGLMSAGADIAYGGICPTPTVAFAARSRDAGVMITASHNPGQYNGIKLFRSDGSSYTPDRQQMIENNLDNPAWASWDNPGIFGHEDLITPHKERILAETSVPEQMSIVLDCGNGAGGVITPQVLAASGAVVYPVSCDPSGFFARPSEPTEQNLSHMPGIIRETRASCGIANDGDADRMTAFDNRGRFIDGDHLLMLFARYLGAKRVVTTADASMAVEEIAEVRRTPVGDSYVSAELLGWGDFGGEPSGSWIFPGHSLCPDGPYAAALFCEIAGEWDIAEELDAMPRYPILRDAVLTPEGSRVLAKLGAENPTDGIRAVEESGWYLIRASGTEPKIRCTAEGKTAADARRLLEDGMRRIKSALADLR
jgi:phosphoglucosamine mutase